MPVHHPRYGGALGNAEMTSDLLVLDQVRNGIDAVAELVDKSLTALERGDRRRARTWLDRAVLLLPDDEIIPAEYHELVSEARASIGRIRRLADDDA